MARSRPRPPDEEHDAAIKEDGAPGADGRPASNSTLYARLGQFGAVPLAFFKDRRVAGKPNCLRVYIGIESFQGTKDSAYPSHRAVGERVGLGEEAVADAVKLLVEFGWVRATARRGTSYLYECLPGSAQEEQFEITDNRGNERGSRSNWFRGCRESLPPPGESPEGTLGKVSQHTVGRVSRAKSPCISPNTKSPDIIDESIDSSPGASSSSTSRKGSPGRGKLLPEYREALRDALRAGRFRNRLPDDEGQAVPKLILRAQRFLGALRRGTLLEEYKFDERWLKKHNFDFSISAEADIPGLVHRAARRYAMMREEGYWPPVKNALTRDIDVFFFHPETRKSMFLYCVFNPAKPLEESSGNRQGDAGVPLSEEERKVILGHMRPGWDEAQYLGRAADLLAWYRENGEAIEVYNYYVRNQSGPWSEHFSSFGSLLDTIDHFARRWKSWALGNFGRGNRTWAAFVAWCRNTYSIELEPPPDGMKVALGMREQSLREAKARRDEELARKREEEQVPDAEDVEGEGFTYEEPIVVDPRW